MTPEEKDRLIQERIASIAANGGKELDLSSLGLATIPEAVFALDKLETFKFMNNYLTEIPVGLTQMRRLKALYLYNNRIQHVDKRLLVDLPYLDCLDLGGNPFDYYAAVDYFYKHNPWKGYAECLKKIERNKEIGYDTFSYHGNLSVFPKEVFALSNLVSLTIYGTHIKDIPPGIHKLKSLRNLNLDNNELFELPDDVIQLDKLEYISLINNKFRVFPDVLLELPALKRIYLAGNSIEHFPVDAVLDERFEVVDGLGNPIKNFSSGLFHLSMEEIRQHLRH